MTVRSSAPVAAFGRSFASGYRRSLSVILARPGLSLLVPLLFAMAAGVSYTALDRELVPPEDRGVLRIAGIRS